MSLRLMFDSYTIGIGLGLGQSEDLDFGSGTDILNNWVYQCWEGHTGGLMINAHLSLIDFANTLPIRAKGGKAYACCVHFICLKYLLF